MNAQTVPWVRDLDRATKAILRESLNGRRWVCRGCGLTVRAADVKGAIAAHGKDDHRPNMEAAR